MKPVPLVWACLVHQSLKPRLQLKHQLLVAGPLVLALQAVAPLVVVPQLAAHPVEVLLVEVPQAVELQAAVRPVVALQVVEPLVEVLPEAAHLAAVLLVAVHQVVVPLEELLQAVDPPVEAHLVEHLVAALLEEQLPEVHPEVQHLPVARAHYNQRCLQRWSVSKHS